MSSSVWISGAAFVDSLNLGLAGLRNNSIQSLTIALKTVVQQAQQAKSFADRTGKLRQSIGSTQSGLEGRAFAAAPHAAFVEFGTRPHPIVAKNGGVLAFSVNGAMVFTRRVNHPGTPATMFFGKAADVGAQSLEYLLEDAARRAFG